MPKPAEKRVAFNPRFVAYARAHRATPEQILRRDRALYRGGAMAGFIAWMEQKAAAFEAQTGIEVRRAQAEFTRWLEAAARGRHV